MLLVQIVTSNLRPFSWVGVYDLNPIKAVDRTVCLFRTHAVHIEMARSNSCLQVYITVSTYRRYSWCPSGESEGGGKAIEWEPLLQIISYFPGK